MNEDYSIYQQNDIASQIASASSYQLVMMLFDNLRDELVRVKGHMQDHRYEKKGLSINRCVNILNGLSSSLDLEHGGEVAVNLTNLYDYCAYRLYDASDKLDVSIVEEVETIIAELYSAWEGIAKYDR